MDNYLITFASWDKVADAYQDAFMEMRIYNESYDIFCEKIATNEARILELGCGPGNITKYLLNKRPKYKIHAIDTSQNMIKLAMENNPTASFSVMDCRAIGTLTEKYDGIISGFCLPYLAKDDCETLIKHCAALLDTNGCLYISTIEGKYEQSGYEVGSTGDKMYVHYYEHDFLSGCLENNNFSDLESISIPYTKRDGTTSTHLVIMARKNN